MFMYRQYSYDLSYYLKKEMNSKTNFGGALTHAPYLQASMHTFYLGYSIHYIKLTGQTFILKCEIWFRVNWNGKQYNNTVFRINSYDMWPV